MPQLGLILLTTLTLLICPPSAVAQVWYDLDKLPAITSNYLSKHYQGLFPDYDVRVSVKAPDSRLKLKPCAKELTPDPTNLPPLGGKISIKLQCKQPQRWNLYVSAQVSILAPVIHSANRISRGQRITQSDLKPVLMPLDQAPNGYILATSDIIGLEARRSLAPQQPLRRRDLLPPLLIQRGDRVQIAANIGGLTVITPGTAMNNGRLGQQITIENLHSQRRVRAKVVAEGRVEVPL